MAEEREAKALRELEIAEQAAELALTRLESARNRLALISVEPPEPKEGSIVKFWVRFSHAQDATVYTYVANRAGNGRWYLTNKEGGKTWDDLLALMMKDIDAKEQGVGFFLYKGKHGQWIGRPKS